MLALVVAGAKAVAEAARVARMASFIVVVDIQWSVV